MATAAHRARGRVRRETAGAYLKAAGIGVRPPGAWERRPPAKPANENQVTTGSDAAKPTPTINPNPENLSTEGKAKATSKPANAVTAGLGVESTGLEVEEPKRIRSAITSLSENNQTLSNSSAREGTGHPWAFCAGACQAIEKRGCKTAWQVGVRDLQDAALPRGARIHCPGRRR
jgi:hypothetical protein